MALWKSAPKDETLLEGVEQEGKLGFNLHYDITM